MVHLCICPSKLLTRNAGYVRYGTDPKNFDACLLTLVTIPSSSANLDLVTIWKEAQP